VTDDASSREQPSQFRLAAERLYEDTRLRDGLDDSQAEQLLSWGLGEIERAVTEGGEGSAEAEATPLEERAETVREVIVRVNRLMDNYRQWTEGQRRDQMAHLVEWLCRVRPRPLQIGEMMRLEALSAAGSALSPQEFFATLFAVIAGEEEE
jgi:hypothetical protein